ncbi:uncharacterized protein LOC112494917 [Cephus cinctus]|uniref:Uncharacterized protein LOC112494917 n=1 Tax=Cephus cinctus TaxID=211228 RepID=A0AAJ7W5C5_CEPCN|nr:uncharacterized protein LOC112494917 [Cephus cinctus]
MAVRFISGRRAARGHLITLAIPDVSAPGIHSYNHQLTNLLNVDYDWNWYGYRDTYVLQAAVPSSWRKKWNCCLTREVVAIDLQVTEVGRLDGNVVASRRPASGSIDFREDVSW